MIEKMDEKNEYRNERSLVDILHNKLYNKYF